MHELAHEYTKRVISPWGGIKFFHKTYVTSGIRDYLCSQVLPEPGSNNGFSAIDLIEGFMTSVVLGSRRLEHSGMLRMDEVISEIFGWKRGMASASTFSRFFPKFDAERIHQLFPGLMRTILSKVPMRFLTIDIDNSIITRYGHQEKAEVGYNPHKRGRRSHAPIMAFCDELKMVVNGWMKPGNSDIKTEAIEFLDEVFTIVPQENIGLIRGDVGLYSSKIMSHLEGQISPVKYIIKARMTSGVWKRIVEIENWLDNSDVVKHAGYAEIDYRATGWKKSRRLIIVRRPKREVNKVAKGLFKEFDELGEFEYDAIMTNTKLSPVEVHRRYNQRGDSENRIKELKYDYGMDGFALQKFHAADAAFRFILVAYNIMVLFKKVMTNSMKNSHLSTVRFQCIAVGSYLIRSGRQTKMKLSAEGKRRHFLEHIFSNLEQIRPPYRFSTA
jgi:hypothetical protein